MSTEGVANTVTAIAFLLLFAEVTYLFFSLSSFKYVVDSLRNKVKRLTDWQASVLFLERQERQQADCSHCFCQPAFNAESAKHIGTDNWPPKWKNYNEKTLQCCLCRLFGNPEKREEGE